MKKIILTFLMGFCLFLTSCSKEAPAEIILIGENQEEIIYQIKATDDPTEVKEIIGNLNQAKLEMNFNGVALDLNTKLEGKILITNQEVRTIDLGYTLDIEARANLKKYRMNGSILLDGYTNTDSDSLSLKNKNKLLLDILNDEDYLYLKGSLEEGNNRLSLKKKISIQSFTKEYKAIVTSFIDLMKYYKLTDIIPNYEAIIDEYHITISKTTKDSFTLRLRVPANLIFKELGTDLTLDIDVEIATKNLLPIRLQFQADDVISLILENEYVEKYLSSTVQVEKAKLTLDVKMNYDYYTIEELSEEDKANYKEYLLN